MQRTATQLLQTLGQLNAVLEPRGDRLAIRFPESQRAAVEQLQPEIALLKPELLKALAKPGKGTDRLRDEYWRRATEALGRISRLKHLGQAIQCLERSDPTAHHHLMVVLPDHLDALWASHAPLGQFQEALDRWVDAHRSAVQRFIASRTEEGEAGE